METRKQRRKKSRRQAGTKKEGRKQNIRTIFFEIFIFSGRWGL